MGFFPLGFCCSVFGVTERLKPGCEAQIEEIEGEIKCKLEKVGWLPGFYALPPDVQIANSNAYREGKVCEKIKQLLSLIFKQEIPNSNCNVLLLRLFLCFRCMESMRRLELLFQH